MRYTNSECLETMLLAMQRGIAPALPTSESTKVALGTVMQGLEELLKRETVTPDFLRKLIPDGLSIARSQLELLEKIGGNGIGELKQSQTKLESFNPDWGNVAGLNKKYNDLIAHLENCSRLLF